MAMFVSSLSSGWSPNKQMVAEHLWQPAVQ